MVSHRMWGRYIGPLLVLGAVAGTPGTASAINGTRPRTPPTFYDASCVQTIERGDASVRLGYTVPLEDTELSQDERTLAFHALPFDLHPAFELPSWTRVDDVDRALASGIVTEAPGDDAILESSPMGAGALLLTPQRRPTSCEAVDDGIAWPTDAPVGVYAVWGYTFEPPTSLWTRRPGLIRVVDGDEAPGPALSLTTPFARTDIFADAGATIRGCLAADLGTSIEFSWATAAEPEVWTPFATVVPDGEAVQVDFVPPPQTVFSALYVRGVATDPQGRTWTSYAPGELVPFATCPDIEDTQTQVLPDVCGLVPASSVERPSAARSCDDPGSMPTPDPGETETEADPEPDAETETDGATAAGGGDGCQIGSRGPHVSWLLVVLVWVRRRPGRHTMHRWPSA